MSSIKPNIPIIAITPEAEEDDDHNYFTLAEVLTDTELLDSDAENYRSEIKKSTSKLKIKVRDDYDCTTDIENMEASEEESDDEKFFLPNCGKTFSLDHGVLKETHKMRSKNNKGKKKLHTQSSTTVEPTDGDESSKIKDVLTDYEDCCATDDDGTLLPEIPDTILNDNVFDSESTNVYEQTVTGKIKQSPNVTPYPSGDEGVKVVKSMPKVSLYLTPPNKPSKIILTDVENLESDSEEEKKSTKKLNSNRRVRRRKPKSNDPQTRSCQKNLTSRKKTLAIEVNDDEDVLTEAEYFEEELPKYEKKACKSSDDDELNMKRSRSSKFDKTAITFVESNEKKSKVGLSIPTIDEGGHTDTEMLNSSDEEREYAGAHLAVVKTRQDYLTDEEYLSGEEDFNSTYVFRDLPLPEVSRKLISIKSNEDNRPVITVSPLPDYIETGLFDIIEDEMPTEEEEDLSDSSALLYVETLSRGPTPDISMFDYGFEESKDEMKIPEREQKAARSLIADSLTDTEDISVTKKKDRKKPKKFASRLGVEVRDENPHTDTEELVVSEKDGQATNVVVYECDNSADLTDTENMALSDFEKIDDIDKARSNAATPAFLREMGGETLICREGLGPFSAKVRLDVNKRVLRVPERNASPTVTDTEDLVESADEAFEVYSRAETSTPIEIRVGMDDNSSTVFNRSPNKYRIEATDPVMYLRGGCFREVYTDTEDMNLSDEEYHECKFAKKVSVDILGDDKVLLSTKTLCANLESCPISTSLKNRKEWNTSGKQPGGETVSPRELPSVGVLHEGEVAGNWQTSASPRQTVPFRGEQAESSAEGAASQESQARQVSDQHQLSEEMRKLLEEMEKDSKK